MVRAICRIVPELQFASCGVSIGTSHHRCMVFADSHRLFSTYDKQSIEFFAHGILDIDFDTFYAK